MKNKALTYSDVGDNYDTKDPTKKLAQTSARATANNLKKHGYPEVSDSRGESAFVWQQGNSYMASVIEGLGTKNLVADEMYKITGKSYYDVIAHDTVATIINDLITVGAAPLVVHAYWAVEDNLWLADEQRMTDLITGWKDACNIAGATWGGGETPTLKGIMIPNTAEFGGSAIGIIKPKGHLVTDTKLKEGDRIILVKSNGINANGLSLARAVSKRLKKGYATELPDGMTYGEAILQKSNIYAKLIQELFKNEINIHYISNITGHGLRKIMRARQEFTYVIDKILEPQPLFPFIQMYAELPDIEMYQTYNMGMDYAFFVSAKDSQKTLKAIKKSGFEAIDAGYVIKGKKQVIIAPKGITYSGDTLDLR